MTTMPFRQHDQVPTNVGSAIYRQLLQEWVDLNALTSSKTTVARWARLEPALAGHQRPGDLVDAIDAATSARKDELLLALIRLFHRGHQLAGRCVLQTMLPKLLRITTTTSPTSSDNAWLEDRHHIALAEFWDVMSGYPVDRRPTKVASNLALDTLHRVSGVRHPQQDIPYDPAELPADPRLGAYTFDHAAAAGSLTADADLVQTITWGVAHRAISPNEGTLLAWAYLPTRGGEGFAAAAAHIGISSAAARQRCSRASRRLRDAVRAEVDDGLESAVAASA